MAQRKLTIVTRIQGNNQALKDGSVRPRGVEFDFQDVPVLIDGFRRMVRGLEFDVSEMALSTYLCAREHGTQFTALPVFLVRAFHHGAILVNTKAGIATPKDLEGKRVGVNRGYTVTTGLWARSVLQQEYDVDLSRITWVLSGDEHVAQYQPPGNVVPVGKGEKIADLLVAGELAAAIGIEVDHPDVRPLIPQAPEAGFDALRLRGHYPANHLIVMRDDLLAAEPQLAVDVFDAFARAKRQYLGRLQAGAIEQPTAADRMHLRVMEITGRDPLPYGIEPNRPMLQEWIEHCLTQGIITRRVAVDDLFAPATRALVG